MVISNLQNVFNKITAGEEVYLLFATKKSYDSVRVNLLRKFRNLKELYESLGADSPYDGKFLQCSFEKDTVRGRFVIADGEKRKNIPASEKFQVLDL
jgi:hypothetical protein